MIVKTKNQLDLGQPLIIVLLNEPKSLVKSIPKFS